MTISAADYVVAVEAINYMPLYDGTTNVYRGYARDLLGSFAWRYGYTFRYVPLPINRLFTEVYVDGQYDFKFPDNIAWQPNIKKDKKIIYSNSVITLNEGIFVPARRVGQGIGKLRYIATIAGFSLTPYAALIKSGHIVVYPTNSFSSLFKMSTVERVDGIYANVFAVKYFQAQQTATPNQLVLDRSLPYISSSFSLVTTK